MWAGKTRIEGLWGEHSVEKVTFKKNKDQLPGAFAGKKKRLFQTQREIGSS